jgi:YVTN family beta-propeller protein
MTSNHGPASAPPPPGKQAAMTGWPGRGGTAPDTHGTGPAPRRRAAALAVLAVPLAVTALTAIPAAAATTGPYANAATIGVGYNPDAVAVNPSTHKAYVANSGGNTVSVINGASVIATIGVGHDPDAVAVDPSTDTVYVVNRNDLTPNENYGTVSVINGATGKVTATITLDGHWEPDGVAVDPSTHTAYVANGGNGGNGTVSVINGATCNGTVTTGCSQTRPTITVGSFPDAVGWTRPRRPPT